MFLAEPCAYLQLQKTGCTHTAMLLAHVCGGQQIGKHNRLPEALRDRVRFVLGSVRNPWDWYVSVWAAGCGGNGRLFLRPTSSMDQRDAPHPREALWRRLYADAGNPELFREWLCRIHDPETCGDMGREFADSPAHTACGLMTFAYTYLYARDITDLFSSDIASPRRLQALIAENILDFTIRTESLEADLVSALEHCGVRLTGAQLSFIWSAAKTNTSVHKRTSHYYDRASREFVAARDGCLIDHYGYAAPAV